MNKIPEVIEYGPLKRETGATGRIVKSFGVLGVLMLVMGIYRGSVPDSPTMTDAASMALIWYFLAFVFGGIALLVGYLSWVRTGRAW